MTFHMQPSYMHVYFDKKIHLNVLNGTIESVLMYNLRDEFKKIIEWAQIRLPVVSE